MNPISALNEHCQKNAIKPVQYTFDEHERRFTCTAVLGTHTIRGMGLSKQAAKEQAADRLWATVGTAAVAQKFTLAPDYPLLIDGDQRMDCWKWLSANVTGDTSHIHVFVSPTCPIPDGAVGMVWESKTTNRDSSDALLLVTLGRMLPFTGAIISSDHILVQAAQDLGIDWAPDLKRLQSLLAGRIENVAQTGQLS